MNTAARAVNPFGYSLRYILIYCFILYIISKFQISIIFMFIRIFKLIRSVNKY